MLILVLPKPHILEASKQFPLGWRNGVVHRSGGRCHSLHEDYRVVLVPPNSSFPPETFAEKNKTINFTFLFQPKIQHYVYKCWWLDPLNPSKSESQFRLIEELVQVQESKRKIKWKWKKVDSLTQRQRTVAHKPTQPGCASLAAFSAVGTSVPIPPTPVLCSAGLPALGTVSAWHRVGTQKTLVDRGR